MEFFVYPLLTFYPQPLYAIFLRSYLVRLLLTVAADTCLFGVNFGVRELTLNFVFIWETRRASLFLKKETKQGNKETRTKTKKQRTKACYQLARTPIRLTQLLTLTLLALHSFLKRKVVTEVRNR